MTNDKRSVFLTYNGLNTMMRYFASIAEPHQTIDEKDHDIYDAFADPSGSTTYSNEEMLAGLCLMSNEAIQNDVTKLTPDVFEKMVDGDPAKICGGTPVFDLLPKRLRIWKSAQETMTTDGPNIRWPKHQDKVAFIVNGDSHEERHFHNVRMMVSALLYFGFEPHEIIVASDGIDDLHPDITVISPSEANIEMAITERGAALSKDGLFFFYSTGHGDLIDDVAQLALPYRNTISIENISHLLSGINGRALVSIADQCFSGHMPDILVDNVGDRKEVVAMAPNSDKVTTACGAFIPSFVKALEMGFDVNGDGVTDFDEAFQFALKEYNSKIAKPGNEIVGSYRRSVKAVTMANLEEILSQKGPMIIDITAPWCGACRSMEKTIDNLNVNYSNAVTLYRIYDGTSEEGEAILSKLAQRFPNSYTNSYPTILYFYDGQLKGVRVGAAEIAELKDDFSTYMDVHPNQEIVDSRIAALLEMSDGVPEEFTLKSLDDGVHTDPKMIAAFYHALHSDQSSKIISSMDYIREHTRSGELQADNDIVKMMARYFHDPEVRAAAIKLTIWAYHLSTVSFFLKALQDPAPIVRQAALEYIYTSNLYYLEQLDLESISLGAYEAAIANKDYETAGSALLVMANTIRRMPRQSPKREKYEKIITDAALGNIHTDLRAKAIRALSYCSSPIEVSEQLISEDFDTLTETAKINVLKFVHGFLAPYMKHYGRKPETLPKVQNMARQVAYLATVHGGKVRKEAFNILRSYFTSYPGYADVIIALLESGQLSEEERVDAVKTLSSVHQEVRKYLPKILNDTNEDVRSLALRKISPIIPGAQNIVFEALSDKSPKIRHSALQAIGRFRDREIFVPSLMKAAQDDPSSDNRAQAIKTLMFIPRVHPEEILEMSLKDPHPNCYARALSLYIHRHRKTDRATLVAILKEKYPTTSGRKASIYVSNMSRLIRQGDLERLAHYMIEDAKDESVIRHVFRALVRADMDHERIKELFGHSRMKEVSSTTRFDVARSYLSRLKATEDRFRSQRKWDSQKFVQGKITEVVREVFSQLESHEQMRLINLVTREWNDLNISGLSPTLRSHMESNKIPLDSRMGLLSLEFMALKEGRDPENAPYFVKALYHSDSRINRFGIVGLRTSKNTWLHSEHRDRVMEFFTKDNPSLQVSALYYFERVKDDGQDLLPHVLPFAKHDSPFHVRCAMNCLKNIKSINEMIFVAEDNVEHINLLVRETIPKMLYGVIDQRVVPILEKLAKDPETRVSDNAKRSLTFYHDYVSRNSQQPRKGRGGCACETWR